MYGAQEDGSVGEGDLSCILKTALGVAELTVTDLFRAIDQEEKGKITFGEPAGVGSCSQPLGRGQAVWGESPWESRTGVESLPCLHSPGCPVYHRNP